MRLLINLFMSNNNFICKQTILFITTFILLITMMQSFAEKNFKVFPLSTEMQIGKMRNLINKAPGGIYLTVGGERAFRGASMFEGIEHLIILDISPIIIKFNKINIELLKAKNKEDYKKLRWSSNFFEWKKTSSILTEQDFVWWVKNIRNIKGYDLPENLNKNNKNSIANNYIKIRKKLLSVYPRISQKFNNREQDFLRFVTWNDVEKNQYDLQDPLTKKEFTWFDSERKHPESCVKEFIHDPETVIDWRQVIDYKSGNYLFDDQLYYRLHNLILGNKITVIKADLTKQEGVDLVKRTIQEKQSKLAVLDLNNLYLYSYMGEEKFRIALSQLLHFGDKSSILVLMNNYKDYPCAQFSIYLGFTFEHIIGTWPKAPFFDAFINSIPSDIQPLLDGRLYEITDELPFYLMKSDKF